eukprot:3467978-Rhodomonas_salina.1
MALAGVGLACACVEVSRGPENALHLRLEAPGSPASTQRRAALQLDAARGSVRDSRPRLCRASPW